MPVDTAAISNFSRQDWANYPPRTQETLSPPLVLSLVPPFPSNPPNNNGNTHADHENPSGPLQRYQQASPQIPVVSGPNWYAREAHNLAAVTADQASEAEETAYQLGAVLLEAIELIQRLALVEGRRNAAQTALNEVLDHASNQGIDVELPQPNVRIRARRDGPQSLPVFEGHNHSSARRSAMQASEHTRHQTQQLGFTFSNNPSVLSGLVDRIWAQALEQA